MENDTQKDHFSKGSYLTYSAGFILSIGLTLAAYLLVKHHADTSHLVYSHRFLEVAILGLAVVQFAVQAVFFLHLSPRSRSRWNLLVFFFMLLTVLIIVIGSLWIIHNLNYRMMPDQINQYLKEQDGGI